MRLEKDPGSGAHLRHFVNRRPTVIHTRCLAGGVSAGVVGWRALHHLLPEVFRRQHSFTLSMRPAPPCLTGTAQVPEPQGPPRDARHAGGQAPRDPPLRPGAAAASIPIGPLRARAGPPD